MHSATHVGKVDASTSSIEARVAKVEQQQNARQRQRHLWPPPARALATRVAQIDQRVSEQAEQAQAHGDKLKTAFSRLAALQERQNALGREQQ